MTRLLACSSFVFDVLATVLSVADVGGQVASGAWLLAGMLTISPLAFYILTMTLASLEAPQVLTLDEFQQPASCR